MDYKSENIEVNNVELDYDILKKYALFKKIVALGYLIQQKYRNDIRNMLP